MTEKLSRGYASWFDVEGYELVVRQVPDEGLLVQVFRPGAVTSLNAVALSDEQVDELIDTLIEHRTLSRPDGGL